jgi:putative membrane protein
MISLIHAAAAAHPGWGDGRGGPWWLLFPLIWIAVVGTVIWIVVRRRETAPADRAPAILAARYARGEIDTEEYRRRRDELEGLS